MNKLKAPELGSQMFHNRSKGVKGIQELGYLSIFERAGWNWDLVRARVLAGYSEKSNHNRLVKQVKALFDKNFPNV